MNNVDYKNELLNMVNNLGKDKKFWNRIEGTDNKNSKSNFNKKSFSKDNKNKGDGPIGSNNLRNVANICQNADCYQEVKLYIQYKVGKGNGWDERLSDGRVFGHAVIEDMDRIYKDHNKKDIDALKMISLYFGYLYWKKRAIESGEY